MKHANPLSIFMEIAESLFEAVAGTLPVSYVRRLMLGLALSFPLAGQAADSWTLTLPSIAIDAPNGCKVVQGAGHDSPGKVAQCLLVRPDASGLFVTLDEWLGLKVKPGHAPEKQVMIAVALNDNFMDFFRGSIVDSPVHKISAAVIPSSQLPRGMAACKSYTLDLSDQSENPMTIHELGIYCARWSDRDNGVIIMIGSVANQRWPARHELPSGFDAQARRILSTFRAR